MIFHGVLDEVFNVSFAKVYLSPVTDNGTSHAAFNSESDCLNASPFKVNASASSPDLIVAGAMGIRNYLLQPLGIKNEIYLDCQMYHTLDNNGAGFHSDFGTGVTTRDAVIEYQAGRAATFFQAIIGNNVNSLVKDLFRECENLRVGCNTADNSSGGCCLNCNFTNNSKCDKNQQ